MLTTQPFNDQIDLSPWVGQRSATFIFRLVNGVTGENLGEINPIRGNAQRCPWLNAIPLESRPTANTWFPLTFAPDANS